MKQKILTLAMLAFSASLSAQDKVRSISVEAFGAQNTIGINYDSRFKGNAGLGYRIGIGYGYGDNSSWFDQNINGVGIPLELNYLLGKKHSKLELGFGTSLGVYRVKETTWQYEEPTPPDTEGVFEPCTSQSTHFGYFLFGDIGYRYQRDNGFLFRIGISPSFNFGDKNGLEKSAFYPYIGLGWSF